MKYTRLYTDSDGESHFEHVEEEMRITEIASTAIMGLTEPKQAANVFFADLPPGYSSEFHPAPRRFLVLVKKGEIRNMASDGEVLWSVPGDVVLLDDLDGKGHKTIDVDESGCELVFVALSG